MLQFKPRAIAAIGAFALAMLSPVHAADLKSGNVAVTATTVANQIKTQTGCSTAGYVWVPASNSCVPQTAGTSLPVSAPLLGTNSSGNAISVSSIPYTSVTGLGTAATQNTAGAGAAIVTGPTTDVAGDLLTYTGTAGQVADSGIALTSVPRTASAVAGLITSQTGCSTAGYVWVPASNTCVAQTGSGALPTSAPLLATNSSAAATSVALAPTLQIVGGVLGPVDFVNPETTTTPYTIQSTDMGKTVTHAKTTAVAVSLPQSGTTGFAAGTSFTDLNLGAGAVTITPSGTSQFNGLYSQVLHQYGWEFAISDGANWNAIGFPGFGTITSNALAKYIDGSGATTASSITDSGTAVAISEPLTLSSITGSTQCLQVSTAGVVSGTGAACGSGSGGAVSSVFGRTGAVTATAGDYTVSQVTGAAPLASPTFTGTVTLPASQVVNGVTLTSTGSATQFLNAAGSYVAPSGSGGGINPVLSPVSFYTADTAGNLFPYVYTGAGGNASPSEAGWGVAASLATDVALQVRFQMPPAIPSTGTFKLISYCLANATTGVAKYTVSDANVAAGSSPSAATLSAETQVSNTWTAADLYVVSKTALTSVPTADGVSTVAITFNHTGWTLASIMSCRFTETWE